MGEHFSASGNTEHERLDDTISQVSLGMCIDKFAQNSSDSELIKLPEFQTFVEDQSLVVQGKIYLALAQNEKACIAFAEKLTQNPKDIIALFGCAEAYLELFDSDDADYYEIVEGVYKKILSIDEKNIEAVVSLAKLALGKGNVGRFQYLCAKIRELDPHHPYLGQKYEQSSAWREVARNTSSISS